MSENVFLVTISVDLNEYGTNDYYIFVQKSSEGSAVRTAQYLFNEMGNEECCCWTSSLKEVKMLQEDEIKVLDDYGIDYKKGKVSFINPLDYPLKS